MTVKLRKLPADSMGPATLTVCVNMRPDNGISVSCGPRGGNDIAEAVRREVASRDLEIEVTTIRCLGLCQRGPNVRLAPGNSWFHGVRIGDVAELVTRAAGHMARDGAG